MRLCRPVFIVSVLACAMFGCLYKSKYTGSCVGPDFPLLFKLLKFDPLILRKIIKIVATRCQTLRLKCTKFDFGWGSAPDPAGELTAFLQTP